MAIYNYYDTTGLIVPDTSTLLTQVQDEFKIAFGTDTIVTSDTPQGVLITGETSARVAVVNNNANIANQINPNYAGGLFLDALCSLMGIYRAAATFTTIPAVTVSGIPFTQLVAGIVAKSVNGDLFASDNAVQLNSSGVATVGFTALQSGTIQCAAGELNQVVTGVLGWEGVTNTQGADFIGSPRQSDDSLRAARLRRLALYGKSSAEAQISGLWSIQGVIGVQFRENDASVNQTIDTIPMVPHSIWACVDGGSDTAIATSLLNNKTDGAAWNGAVIVPVVEPYSGQTYTVKFDRPVLVPLICSVTVRQGTYTGDLQLAVRKAINDYVLGNLAGFAGFVVGADASPFELSSAITTECQGAIVTNVMLALLSGGTLAPATVPMLINQKATLQPEQISVTVIV